jgi:hypothetical protein
VKLSEKEFIEKYSGVPCDDEELYDLILNKCSDRHLRQLAQGARNYREELYEALEEAGWELG